jgi:hypothetical protein
VEILNPALETQFKWYHNENLIENIGNTEIETNQNSSFLKLRNLQTENSGKYICKITNKIGTTESFTNIKINIKPKFVRQLINVDATEGENIEIKCEFIGIPEPKLLWYKNAQPYRPILGSTILYEKNECTLTILKAKLSDIGEYKCKAVNKLGTDEVSASVAIKGRNLKYLNS